MHLNVSRSLLICLKNRVGNHKNVPPLTTKRRTRGNNQATFPLEEVRDSFTPRHFYETRCKRKLSNL